MTTQLDVQGRRTIEYWTNKSGGAIAYGDVVINDSANDEAFTTTTTAGFIGGQIGVCIEANGIANNAQGRIAVGGHVEQINLNASGTRGHFVKTHTVAKQGTDAGTSRVAGAFAVLETTGTTPKATLFGIPDASTGSAGSPGTPALTLDTTNGVGAAVTLIATDATIAAFDATAPTTQAFGDAAATGSAGKAARRDHKHAMPANPAEFATQAATVATDQTTSSTSYADLATSGPAVTVVVPSSGKVKVTLSAITYPGGPTAADGYMSVALSSGNTVAASDTRSLYGDNVGASRTFVMTGLTPGSTVFTAKYRTDNGGDSHHWANREIIVEPVL